MLIAPACCVSIEGRLNQQKKAKEKLPARVYSKELIETIFRQPDTKGQFLVDAGIARRQTAAEYLKEPEKIGILKHHKIGKETLFLNVDLYGLHTRVASPQGSRRSRFRRGVLTADVHY